ncbi:acetylglutamate kinase [Clostridium sp. WILCCON 0269]|uniref:Acetylglutamate kinase n=1 Tax=Candidatus Clostridium eludens TaxID=3381663 RepID=A0ABW8SPW9_9CLOT
MLCPIRKFFCTIQPYNRGLPTKRYPSNIYPITTVNPGSNFNCLYSRYGDYNESYSTIPTKITKSEVDLINTLRMLWEQHIVWTRITIISILAGLPDVNLVTQRLLRNPVDFEKALKPFYGDRIASQFRDLLKSHLIIAAELVKAAKAGNNQAAANAEKRWYANADEIANFLGRINPYWSQGDWQTMLHEHLKLTKSEAVDILTGNYAEGIKLYDEIEKQALKMADVMAKGIIKQFPRKFIR